MRTRSRLVLLALPLLWGCVSSHYGKSVTIEKDSEGRVVRTWEREWVVQPNRQGWPIKFQHLKEIQP